MCRGKSEKEAEIFLGVSFKRGNPQPWKLTTIDKLMVNAYDMLHRDVRIENIHTLLAYDGKVFCDSGGWQIIQGSIIPSVSEIVTTQKEIGADFSAVLDHGNDEASHLRYLKYYLKMADFEFVPTIPYDMSKKNIQKIRDLVGSPEVIAVGKLVPILRPPINYNMLHEAIRSIIRIRKLFPESKLHIFGLGGLYTILIFFMIADSSDSTSWIHDARYGKIRILSGTGTYSTHPRLGLKHVVASDYHCRCPVCRKHDLPDLDSRGIIGLGLRATHNAWVIQKEGRIIQKLKAENRYVEYVRERLKQSPHHKPLFEFVSSQLEKEAISC